MTLSSLRALLEHLPDTASLTLPIAELRELAEEPTPRPDADLTAAELARHPQLRCSPATIKRWQNEVEFDGAYVDPKGRWRFPPATVEKVLAWHRSGGARSLRQSAAEVTARAETPNPTPPPGGHAGGQLTDLKKWRDIRHG